MYLYSECKFRIFSLKYVGVGCIFIKKKAIDVIHSITAYCCMIVIYLNLTLEM